MERFLKRKIPSVSEKDNCDGGNSRRVDASNTRCTVAHPSLRISQNEVNLDELPYDPADRRKISDYIGQKLQDEIRRKYLLRGLAFRGHDESRESKNKGNFQELVHLLAEQNDKIKKVVLRNAPANNQMVASEIQKDIVNCFAEIIVKSIIEEIDGDVFCLLVDESADVSGKEQMAVVLRYVDKFGLIKERLIGVVHVKETSASCLKSNIDKLFGKYGLSIKQIRGQGYDGASNMRGELNGLRALIVRENSSAYYIYCFAHQLQLVIVAVVKKNDDASDFFEMISLLLTVAGASCKRKDMI
uniref:DUF4371 domain-containing protein n=1 Tax=Oryza brachyantha TaxID=4533 RepID=J3LVR0_ORYBR